MPSRRAHGGRRTRGFTLTELMIAMALAGLVAVALLATAHVQTSLQRQSEQVQVTQDNLRASIEELVVNTRLAGSPFLAGQVLNGVPVATAPAILLSASVVDNENNADGGNGPDALQLIALDDSTPVSTLMLDAPQGTTPLEADNASALRVGDFFVITDLTNAVLYRMTDLPGMQNEQGVTVQTVNILPLSTGPNFQKGALLARVKLLRYHISTAIFGGTPVLTLQDGAPLDTAQPEQVVAENVEDLQVALGVDGLLNGVPDGIIQESGQAANDDEWIFNVSGETLPVPLPPGARLSLLRISVAVRTAQQQDTQGPGRPALENRPAGPPDNYRWRTLTALVSLRPLASN